MRSIFRLLFHCQHKRISRPITLSTKPGVPQADTYVVCLDCGDQLSYDWNRMRIGERIERPPFHHILSRPRAYAHPTKTARREACLQRTQERDQISPLLRGDTDVKPRIVPLAGLEVAIYGRLSGVRRGPETIHMSEKLPNHRCPVLPSWRAAL